MKHSDGLGYIVRDKPICHEITFHLCRYSVRCCQGCPRQGCRAGESWVPGREERGGGGRCFGLYCRVSVIALSAAACSAGTFLFDLHCILDFVTSRSCALYPRLNWPVLPVVESPLYLLVKDVHRVAKQCICQLDCMVWTSLDKERRCCLTS